MTWIESHLSLRRHPKTVRLANALGVNRIQVIGHLQCLWWWAFEYAPEGDLGRFSPAEIAEGAEWSEDPRAFVDALVSAGFLDADGDRLTLHDWEQYTYRVIERRRANAERMRRWRAAHVTRTSQFGNGRPDRTGPTGPDRTGPTGQGSASPTGGPASATAPEPSGAPQPPSAGQAEVVTSTAAPQLAGAGQPGARAMAFGPGSAPFELASLHRELVLANAPKARLPGPAPQDLARWSTEYDRLIRLDGREPAEVEDVLRWTMAHPFWRAQILSPPALRQHYDRLWLQMRGPPGEAGATMRREVSDGDPGPAFGQAPKAETDRKYLRYESASGG